MSTISSGTTLTTALVQTGDTTGNLVIKTGASNTTAMTISGSDQSITFAGAVNVASTAFANGSAAAPSITFTGDTNTGIFSPAADTIGFAEGGVESMRIDASGKLLIGRTSDNTAFGGNLQVEGTSGAFASIVRYSSNAAGAPGFYLARSKSATLGTNTIVASGDTLGTIAFAGANGTGYSDAAYIQAFVDGTPGASADMPGRLVFSTSADGSATPTERMRINSSGNVGIGTSSPGVKLQVDGAVFANLRGNNAILLDSAGSFYGAIQNNSSDVWSLGYSSTAGTLGTPVLTWNGSGNVGFNSGYGSVATAYGCRAWVTFIANGTISASGNISSITKNGTGDYTVNFTNAMPDGNYAAVAMPIVQEGNIASACIYNSSSPSTSSFRLSTGVVGVAFKDLPTRVAVFR